MSKCEITTTLLVVYATIVSQSLQTLNILKGPEKESDIVRSATVHSKLFEEILKN